jgi:hypothetical protein
MHEIISRYGNLEGRESESSKGQNCSTFNFILMIHGHIKHQCTKGSYANLLKTMPIWYVYATGLRQLSRPMSAGGSIQISLDA